MRKKGFTLIELLVVIAIIAMLLAILMPALNKVKKIAQRVVCGTNLKGLGTAQTVYANDYADSYAVQGRGFTQTLAADTIQWDVKTKVWAANQNITVGASLYLLVREADVSPKSFVCPSSDQKEFSGKCTVTPTVDIVDMWDFGSVNATGGGSVTVSAEGPQNTVSYAYHFPYQMGQTGATSTGGRGTYAASGSSTAAFAMMADRNPWNDSKLTKTTPTADAYLNVVALLGTGSTVTDWSQITNKWSIQVANAYTHSREGQNVLFGDGHSSYETRPDVGATNDNVYTRWGDTTTACPSPTEIQRRRGVAITPTTSGTLPLAVATVAPQGADDSVLVNDYK